MLVGRVHTTHASIKINISGPYLVRVGTRRTSLRPGWVSETSAAAAAAAAAARELERAHSFAFSQGPTGRGCLYVMRLRASSSLKTKIIQPVEQAVKRSTRRSTKQDNDSILDNETPTIFFKQSRPSEGVLTVSVKEF